MFRPLTPPRDSPNSSEPYYQVSEHLFVVSPSLTLWCSYLELAMNGPLDDDTRENLNHSHAASKSLLFTINDLLVSSPDLYPRKFTYMAHTLPGPHPSGER